MVMQIPSAGKFGYMKFGTSSPWFPILPILEILSLNDWEKRCKGGGINALVLMQVVKT
jgi:hypothetical protein